MDGTEMTGGVLFSAPSPSQDAPGHRAHLVLAGISEYQPAEWNLEQARRDAEALYELLAQPSHGDFRQRTEVQAGARLKPKEGKS